MRVCGRERVCSERICKGRGADLPGAGRRSAIGTLLPSPCLRTDQGRGAVPSGSEGPFRGGSARRRTARRRRPWAGTQPAAAPPPAAREGRSAAAGRPPPLLPPPLPTVAPTHVPTVHSSVDTSVAPRQDFAERQEAYERWEKVRLQLEELERCAPRGTPVLAGRAASLTPYQLGVPRPSPRTDRTRCVRAVSVLDSRAPPTCALRRDRRIRPLPLNPFNGSYTN